MGFQDWSSDKKSVVATLLLSAGLVALSIVSFRQIWPSHSTGWIIWLGLASGGMGGILHEFAQSGGKLLLTKRDADGIYLGALMGMLLGMLAGVLAVQGLFVQGSTSSANQVSLSTAAAVAAREGGNPTPPAPQSPVAVQVLYTALLAGLGLKGVAEAVGGQPVSSAPGPLPLNARIPIDLPPTPQPPKL
jgi:hypothetical protein